MPLTAGIVEQVVRDDLGVHPRAVGLLQADLDRPERARRRDRRAPQLDDARRGRRGARCRRRSCPRASLRPRSRTPARSWGSRTGAAPSAPMTDTTSEMFAISALRRSSDARILCSASTRSVTSRAFVTMPRTAGSSRRLVATISIERSSPSARWKRYSISSVAPGVCRSRANSATSAGRSSS